MYEIVINPNVHPLNMEMAYFEFKSKLNSNGFLSISDLDAIYQPWLLEGNYVKNEDFGWIKRELLKKEYPIFQNIDESIKKQGEYPLIKMILPDPINLYQNQDPSFDPIHVPSHYVEGRKYEPRKVIADWRLNFNLGNAVKYLSRAGRKGDKIEDLRKAIQYIEFEIEELEDQNEQD